jgi:YjbE family integral membrane protein
MIELLGAIGSIILVDLVLSGDNALLIGAAAAGLPQKQRWLAIAFGGGAAIVLRITFAVIATLLLRLPLLQAIGGLLLLFIAIKLLADRESKVQKVKPAEERAIASDNKRAGNATLTKGFMSAFWTILVADVTMSLDNVLAVGALAGGDLILLAAGILLSVIILLLGSALVAELIERLPWLLDVAALVLAWTGAHMILEDIRLGPVLDNYPWTEIAIPVIAFATVLGADVFLRIRDSRRTSDLKAVRQTR